jgi:hypothetical protein
MNKQKIILDLNNILNTYQKKMPHSQIRIFKERMWLPLSNHSNLSGEFAYLVAKIMGDGHLDSNFVVKFSGQEKELKELKKIIFSSLNIDIRKIQIYVSKAKGIAYTLNVNDALLGRTLFCLGAPMGNKTKSKFLVPDWIMESKTNSHRFLQGLLEDELSTVKIEKKTHSNKPRLKMAKCEKLLPNLRTFLNQIRIMLYHFDINCSVVSNKANHKEDQITRDLYFDICRNKENIIRFGENVGFRVHKVKIKKLNECVKILKNTKYIRKPVIDIQEIVRLRKLGYTIREISKKVNLNKTSVHSVVKKSVGEGI